MAAPHTDARVAVFFDVDNLWISARDAGVPFDVARVMQGARQFGTVIFSRAYADWATNRHLLPEFARHAIEMTELSTSYGGKNTADMQIATDAMEIALTGRAPEAIVLISGDRDFVPLVQKLRRYGIRVVAIGVEGTVSGALQRACDEFISYTGLFAHVPTPVPLELPTVEDVAVQPAPALDQSFPLLLRAVRLAEQNATIPTDGVVLQLMKELDPRFELERYGVSLRQLAESAAAADIIQVSEMRDGTFTMTARSEQTAVAVEPAPSAEPTELKFEGPVEAANRYRAVLMEKRVPLLPFATRSQLVHHLWQAFEYYRPRGMSFARMNDLLDSYARKAELNIPVGDAIRKLTFTLNISQCFSRDGSTGEYIRNPDMLWDSVVPAITDPDAAVREMNLTYLRGIRRDHPEMELMPEAVALLLFDNRDDQAVRDAQSLINDLHAGSRVAYNTASSHQDDVSAARISIGTDELLLAIQASVRSLLESGRRATGAAVREHVVQAYPAFPLAERTMSFKQIAQLAANRGYVQLVEHPGGDFELRPTDTAPQS